LKRDDKVLLIDVIKLLVGAI